MQNHNLDNITRNRHFATEAPGKNSAGAKGDSKFPGLVLKL
jgi:hypothetical protein